MSNGVAKSAQSTRVSTGKKCKDRVVSVAPLEWVYKGDNEYGWEKISKGKWIYVFKAMESGSSIGDCILEIKVLKDGNIKKVDWQSDSGSRWKEKEKREANKKDRIYISKSKTDNIYICISRIQIPYRRISKLVRDKTLIKNRCVKLSSILGYTSLENKNAKVKIKKSQKEPKNARTIYLYDPINILEVRHDIYMGSVAEYYKHASDVRNERKKVRLASMCESVARQYSLKKNTSLSELPLKDGGDALLEYLEDTINKFKVNHMSKEKRWSAKEVLFSKFYNDKERKTKEEGEFEFILASKEDENESPYIIKFDEDEEIPRLPDTKEVINDYMFDVSYDNLKKKGLMIVAKVLSGAIYSEAGRDYLSRIVSGESKNADWFERHFLSDDADPGAFFENADDEDFATIIMSLGTALVTSRGISEARKFVYRSVDGWTQTSANHSSEEELIDLEAYLGNRGFPDQLPTGNYYKEARTLGKGGLGVADKVLDHSAKKAREANLSNLKNKLEAVKKGTSPLLFALVVINLSINVKQLSELSGAQADNVVNTMLGVHAGVSETLSMGLSLLGDMSTKAGNLATAFGIFAGMYTFVAGSVLAIYYGAKGRAGKAIGSGLIAIGGFGAMIYAAGEGPGAFAAGASGTGPGLVIAGLVLFGTAIVLWFTDDDYEEWFRKCPWGVNPNSTKDIEEHTRELLHLIGRPSVSASKVSNSEIQLTIELPMLFPNQTSAMVDPLRVEKVVVSVGSPGTKGVNSEELVNRNISILDINDRNIKIEHHLEKDLSEENYTYIEADANIKVKYIEDVYPEEWGKVDGYKFEDMRI